MDLRKLLTLIIFSLITSSSVFGSETEEEFIKHLFALDFDNAYLVANALDQESGTNYFGCLTDIFHHSGQLNRLDSSSVRELLENKNQKSRGYINLIEIGRASCRERV